MKDSAIRFVVNSELLFEHLIAGAEPLESVRERGMWFEPAFRLQTIIRTKPPARPARDSFFSTHAPAILVIFIGAVLNRLPAQ